MKRVMKAGAVAAAVALVASACGGDASASGRDVEITWWHHYTANAEGGFWRQIADEFEADNPGVRVTISVFEHRDLSEMILPNALAANTAPDIFVTFPAYLPDWSAAGHVKDLSAELPDLVEAVGGIASPWKVDGRAYGLPFEFGPGGFWVNTDLWDQAGLTDFPETVDELFDAWSTLRAAGITPVSLGGADEWPAAHWWYWAALKSVPTEALTAAVQENDFSDPNWVVAGEVVEQILAQEPFQDHWYATSAQLGAASSAGLFAMGEAAMELQGPWHPMIVGGIYNEAQGNPAGSPPPEFMSWFPFPSITGGAGDPTAMMGGGNGFSVNSAAPPEALDLMERILSVEAQIGWAQLGNIPVIDGAGDGVEFAPMQRAAEALQEAEFVQFWMDNAFGSEIQAALNPAIALFMTGQGESQDVVDAITTVAQRREARG